MKADVFFKGYNISNARFSLTWQTKAALLSAGVNGVNRLATKGEKILLTTDKTRKKLPASDKKIN